MTIVELTKTNNTKFFVNLDLVIAYEFRPDPPITQLALVTGSILEVLEDKESFKKYLPK